jgi:hypothetical protein
MAGGPPASPDGMTSQALASMTWIERVLFSRSIEKRISNPKNRIVKRVPKYGVRGATHLELSILWRAVIFMGAVIAIVGQFVNVGGVVAAGVLILLFGGFMAFLRVFSGANAGKEWRAASDDGPARHGQAGTAES